MPQPLLRFDAVSKSFAGRTVVEHLSFDVQRGEVFALLGPNGAGKTTTVRMLVGIIRPDEGRIEVAMDGSATHTVPPATTGYLPEERGLYREIPVHRTLVFFGMLRGLDRPTASARALEWLERMSLLDRKDEKVDALSKGNQQRVQFIAAVIHRPRLAILDEPFTGLDPLSQEFFLDLVRELRGAGTTILLSAHQMDLVERVADRVLLMNQGREILAGSIDELHHRLDARPQVRLTCEPGAVLDALRADPDVEELIVDGPEVRVALRAGAMTAPFLARAVAVTPVHSISTEAPRLHDVFLRAVREDNARMAGNTQ